MSDSYQLLAESQMLTVAGEAIAFEDIAVKPPARVLQEGEIVDQKYRILSLLGEGGMGAVYRAFHLNLNKEVALKTFRTPNLTLESWKRFQREAQTIGRLNHPNIVHVYDFGVGDDQIPYYTMEYLSGRTLAERLLDKGRLSIEEVLQTFMQVCRGLAFAHAKGIVHRDLKPANIFLAEDNAGGKTIFSVKIVDFGIAALANESLDDQRLTRAGMIFGSPLYMSPEQSVGDEVDQTSDIYSCGCSLYQALTGKPPFMGSSVIATMMMHQNHKPPVLAAGPGEPEFPLQLTRLVAMMLAKSPSQRIQSFEEVASAIEQIYQVYLLSAGGQEPLRAVTGYRGAGQGGEPDRTLSTTQETTFEANARQRNRQGVLILAAVLFVLAGIGVLSLAGGQNKAGTAPPAIEKTAVKPYLTNPNDPVDLPRRYQFPNDISVGELSFEFTGIGRNTVHFPDMQEARGEIIVPHNYEMQLTAKDAAYKNPELLKGFSGKDLTKLILDSKYEWKNKHIACIKQMTGLIFLIIGKSELSDDCLDDLNQLPMLRLLSIKNSGLSGKGLAKLAVLPHLGTLYVNAMPDFGLAIDKLAGDSLKMLDASNCMLSDDDIEKLAGSSSLEWLDLGDNPDVTDKSLPALARLTKLRVLRLEQTKISSACVDYFKTLHDLRRLRLDRSKWSAAEKAVLSRALPSCKIEQPDARTTGTAVLSKARQEAEKFTGGEEMFLQSSTPSSGTAEPPAGHK